ncbi:hypothetical protein [Streptomyces nitrosporeus]|uniref:hypothetical protein n=1 Tax=Streptomyces nitrosporeus TaxID=28894 RepID=UPI0039A1CCE1
MSTRIPRRGLLPSGFVVSEGADKGELYSLEEDGGRRDERIQPSDTLVVLGLLPTGIGLTGGNIRAAFRLRGVRPRPVRRAHLLARSAALVAEDYARAVQAVRDAWVPVHDAHVQEEPVRTPAARALPENTGCLRAGALRKGGVRTVRDVLAHGEQGLARLPGGNRRTAGSLSAAASRLADDVRASAAARFWADRATAEVIGLLNALHVLVEAGPGAREAAREGEVPSARLERLLAGARAASGYRRMLRAGPLRRRCARACVDELRALLAEAERRDTALRFAQASVDLLRGADDDSAGLAARVDFGSRSGDYRALPAGVAPEPGVARWPRHAGRRSSRTR